MFRGVVTAAATTAFIGCTPTLAVTREARPATAPPPTPAIEHIDAPVVRDSSIVSIRMFDPENGWAVSQQRVLRTADGAASWHDVSPKPGTTFGYAARAYFLDKLHAWVLVPNANDMLRGILHRSGDGGLTWNESPVPFGGGSMQFLDAKQGWMMAALGAGAGSMAVSVFQTADAGASWTQAFTDDPTQAGANQGIPLGGLKDGISATSMQAAWIGGVTYAPGTVYLYQTRDGGHSWEKSLVSAPAGYEQAELETTGPTFLTAETGYLPVHVSSQNGILLAVYVTHDGGESWVQSPTYIPGGGVSDFYSETAGFAWNGTSFYASGDSAKTWTTVEPDVAFSAGFSGMDFVSSQVGFVLFDDGAGKRRVYKTVDGGATWNVLGQ